MLYPSARPPPFPSPLPTIAWAAQGIWSSKPALVKALGPDISGTLKAVPASETHPESSASTPGDTGCASPPPPGFPAGLRNLGATCYLNSQLQALFANRGFRRGVYAWRPSAGLGSNLGSGTGGAWAGAREEGGEGAQGLCVIHFSYEVAHDSGAGLFDCFVACLILAVEHELGLRSDKRGIDNEAVAGKTVTVDDEAVENVTIGDETVKMCYGETAAVMVKTMAVEGDAKQYRRRRNRPVRYERATVEHESNMKQPNVNPSNVKPSTCTLTMQNNSSSNIMNRRRPRYVPWAFPRTVLRRRSTEAEF